jgi:lysophospholipase L1-like esterase
MRRVGWTLGRTVLAVCAVLLIFELVLRAFGYGNYERYLPDPDLLWVLQPGQRSITHFGHKPVQVNSQGMRGDEFSSQKPPGKIRIISFGDSYTYGYGVGQDDTYPAQLGQLLDQSFPGRYEVFNAGVNGYGTYQELVALKRAVRFQPDIITVSSTYNDSLFLDNIHVGGTIAMDEAPKQRILRSVSLKRIARSVALYNFWMEKVAKWVYWRVKDRLVTGTWSTDHPVDKMLAKYEPIIQEIIREARSRGITIVFVIPHMGGLGPYGEIMVRTAREMNVPYVQMGPIFERYRPEEVFFLDHGHPNEFGNRLIALEIFKLLTRLRSQGGEPPQAWSSMAPGAEAGWRR